MWFVKGTHNIQGPQFLGGICSTDLEVKSMNYFVFVHLILMEQQQVYGTHINIIW